METTAASAVITSEMLANVSTTVLEAVSTTLPVALVIFASMLGIRYVPRVIKWFSR